MSHSQKMVMDGFAMLLQSNAVLQQMPKANTYAVLCQCFALPMLCYANAMLLVFALMKMMLPICWLPDEAKAGPCRIIVSQDDFPPRPNAPPIMPKPH
jgi:hypothetical protein